MNLFSNHYGIKLENSSYTNLFGCSLLRGIGNFSPGMQISSQETTRNAQQVRMCIQMGTNLNVADNSGAKRVMCIQTYRTGKRGARLGDTIMASVKEAQSAGKVKKGEVVYGVVVRAVMQKGRSDGIEFKFDDNAVVLVKTPLKRHQQPVDPVGTRVFGPVPQELRKKHVKILSLAEQIV